MRKKESDSLIGLQVGLMFLSELVFRQRRPVLEGVVQKKTKMIKVVNESLSWSTNRSEEEHTKPSLANLNGIIGGFFSNQKGF